MTYPYKHNKVEKHYIGNKNSSDKVGKIEGTASERGRNASRKTARNGRERREIEFAPSKVAR